MKFVLKSQTPVEVTADFSELVDSLETLLDTYESCSDASINEAAENMKDVQSFIESATEEQIIDYIKGEPELAAAFNGSVEDFKDLLSKSIKDVESMEGFIRDAFQSFGTIITAFIKRNNHTVAYLKPALEALSEKIKTVPKDRFSFRVFRMNIASKYLPSYDQFVAAAAGLKKLQDYLNKVNPGSYVPEDAAATLANTIFNNKKSNANQGALKTIGFFLPGINSFVWAHENADVRQRGWSSSETFTKGIATAQDLVKTIQACNATIEKLKSFKSEDKQELKMAKAMLSTAKFLSKEAGFMCRGLVVAGKKITSGYIGRLAQGLVD